MKHVQLDMKKLEALIRNQPENSDKWLRGVAHQMQGDIRQSMIDSPATGKTYDRGKGRYHVASSPGNPPRPDTGTLINTIRVRPVGFLHYEIVDGVEYGIELEEGTTKKAPRPFMRPVFEGWRSKIVNDAKKHLVDV